MLSILNLNVLDIMKNKRTTIIDVANKAGVSITAVSFAFNNPDQVGVETAGRIKAIANEMGYAPNAIARAMRSSNTGVIGLLVPMSIAASFSNPFFSEFMQGIGVVCDEQSLGVSIVSPYEGSVLKASQRAPVDGFIVLGLNESHAEIEPLRIRRIPFVIVDGEAISTSEININDEEGAYTSANYLLNKGHTKVMILTFEKPVPYHKDNVFYGVGGRRLKGIQRAFKEHNVPFNFDLMVQSETSIEGGYKAFLSSWNNGFHPSAILAMSDAMAIGAINGVRTLGLQVPGEIEVIGFDDILLARSNLPSLSTIHQPIETKGVLAAQKLCEVMKGNSIPEKILLQTELILRESTRT